MVTACKNANAHSIEIRIVVIVIGIVILQRIQFVMGCDRRLCRKVKSACPEGRIVHTADKVDIPVI